MFVNEPLDLNMTETLSGLSCVTANVLHIFGVGPSEPGDWRWVDERIGRGYGEFASHARACRLLAECGLRIYMAGEHDPARVLSEGLSYLREYYALMWDEEWDLYWTPENVAKAQAAARVYLSLESFGVQTEFRSFSLADVEFYAGRKAVVMVAFRNDCSEQCQWWLIVDYVDGVFTVYAPDYHGTTLFRCGAAFLSGGLLVSEGMTAIWR